jgi:hypothetical protein
MEGLLNTWAWNRCNLQFLCSADHFCRQVHLRSVDHGAILRSIVTRPNSSPGGLYDPDNANEHLIDENGFRLDVIEAMKELRVPVVRYPGGNFVATYHWLDGAGPREKRPRRPELAWLNEESNQFGTNEFMKWCEIVGTEPYLCLNFGTGMFQRTR